VAISGNQRQSAPDRILPFEIVWVHRGVIKSTRVHSVAISAHHLPFEIAWVNCGTDKREHETTPHMPHAPCTAQASTGSSICSRIIILEAARYTQPPTAPMMTPAHGITVAQPAVMETSPARIPAYRPSVAIRGTHHCTLRPHPIGNQRHSEALTIAHGDHIPRVTRSEHLFKADARDT